MTEHPTDSLDRLFHPENIAVVGMSSRRPGPANRFVRDVEALGFAGGIFAIHPHASEIDGIPAVASFADLPVVVDYAYIAVAAEHVPPLLAGAAGRVRFAQVMASGFGETGTPEGRELEAKLTSAAAVSGVRLLGPNCLGTHSPSGRISFVTGADPTPGSVGIISQSGGLAVDIIGRGKHRPLRFSGVVTIGNAVDLGPQELLRHFAQDPDTHVIGLYLENGGDARALFETLRTVSSVKPCVLLKGGRTDAGSRAAASHTGALAGDERLWQAMCAQTGTILTETLDEFIDTLTVLQHVVPSPRPTKNIVLVGNGGGTSVLAADAFARRQLDVAALAPDALEALGDLALPPGSSVVNPIDIPATIIVRGDGRVVGDILEIVGRDTTQDAVVVHVNLGVLVTATDDLDTPINNILNALRSARAAAPADRHLVVVLRTDGGEETERLRRHLAGELADAGLPALRELGDAAVVLEGLGRLERHRAARA